MKTKVEYRKIQGVDPVPGMRRFKANAKAVKTEVKRITFWDIFITPNDASDDHLLFTLRAPDADTARAQAKGRLMAGARWSYFDFSTIRAVEAP